MVIIIFYFQSDYSYFIAETLSMTDQRASPSLFLVSLNKLSAENLIIKSSKGRFLGKLDQWVEIGGD